MKKMKEIKNTLWPSFNYSLRELIGVNCGYPIPD